MNNILQRIVEHKIEEVKQGKREYSQNQLIEQIEQQPKPRNFYQAIVDKVKQKQPAVIAEVKKASPSKGVIRQDFDPQKIAQAYQAGGAACLSVLTDQKFFQGHDQYLKIVKQTVTLPILRKDFIIDPWQIYHSRAIGADCILLIVAALSDPQLFEYTELAQQLNLTVLTEVHDEAELQRALATNSQLIGINNRNLKTFKTSLQTTAELAKQIPPQRIVISESGINTTADIKFLQQQKVNSFLIGESLMRQENPQTALENLLKQNEKQ